jgi:uncharacterized damage-inducible protein DinB
MTSPYVNLMRFKQWADEGLYEVIGRTFDQLGDEDSILVRRVLDHILTVDRIFQGHLGGNAASFAAPRSDELPDLQSLTETARKVDDWYVSYVESLSAGDFDKVLDFTFTSGKPARMTRGEILQHVSEHGSYHRGQAGVILQKNGIAPNDDRVTDFLELAA